VVEPQRVTPTDEGCAPGGRCLARDVGTALLVVVLLAAVVGLWWWAR
jgi:hypothetical protein